MTSSSPFVLGIIPARGGSKGIKDKNIIPLNGKPLIAYTLEAAAGSRALSDSIVTTDSSKIADVVKGLGGRVPFLRPANLAEDQSPTLGVLQHAVAEYERSTGKAVTHVVLLQPTAPLRTSADIDQAWKVFASGGKQESLISCYDATVVHPRIMYKRGQGANEVVPFLSAESAGVRRQEFEQVFVRNGAIYICTRELLMNKGKVYSEAPLLYEMPRERSINIDSMDDLALASFYLSGGSDA